MSDSSTHVGDDLSGTVARAKVRPFALHFFAPAVRFYIVTFFCLPSFSVSLNYFYLGVKMSECSGEHSCTSFTFSIIVLNGTCFFLPRRIIFDLVKGVL